MLEITLSQAVEEKIGGIYSNAKEKRYDQALQSVDAAVAAASEGLSDAGESFALVRTGVAKSLLHLHHAVHADEDATAHEQLAQAQEAIGLTLRGVRPFVEGEMSAVGPDAGVSKRSRHAFRAQYGTALTVRGLWQLTGLVSNGGDISNTTQPAIGAAKDLYWAMERDMRYSLSRLGLEAERMRGRPLHYPGWIGRMALTSSSSTPRQELFMATLTKVAKNHRQ